MSKNKNTYQRKAERSYFMSMAEGLPTKGSAKNTLIETAKDLFIGVIGGGLIGSAIGKPSLVAGIGVTGVGHYIGNRLVSSLGVGMMAANGFQTKTVNGIDSGMDGVKDRMIAFKDTFSEKLYLDKFLKKKSESTSVTGFGDLQYFNYANEVSGLAALDSVEEQIENSAMARLQMSGGNIGTEEDGLPSLQGSLADLSDISDYNL
ncbi:hypothetical protein ACE38W_00890 [Chitinophaga sp. Hz27]|uniref:hypothetical protein n=1 Tax=Chitinophaga sp. Hz27 TaxID=3347169 RepID=UPI0035DAD719